MQCPRGPEEGVTPREAGATGGCKLIWLLGTILGSSARKQALFTAELFLQAHILPSNATTGTDEVVKKASERPLPTYGRESHPQAPETASWMLADQGKLKLALGTSKSFLKNRIV